MSESQQLCSKDPCAFPGPDDPPREWLCEETAYARERERLVHDHLGQFVVLYKDEIFGPFDTYGEAVFSGYRRFGDVQLVVKEIRPEEPPDFVSIVDLNHSSMKRIAKAHG